MPEQIDTLKESASGKQARIKELDELLRMADYYQQGKPVADKLKTIRFNAFRQKYKAEHENVLRTFYMTERKLKNQWVDEKTPLIHAWRKEKAKLETEVCRCRRKLSHCTPTRKAPDHPLQASIGYNTSRSARTPLHGRKKQEIEQLTLHIFRRQLWTENRKSNPKS